MQEKTVEFTDKYGECKLVAQYGLQHFQGQEPYFSMTATEYRKRYGVWREDAGGCLHDEIAEHIPELEPLVKWHLVSLKEPMHYIANGMF